MTKVLTLFTACFLLSLSAISQENYKPTEKNLEAREWFQDAKFGLFVHWGVYSVLGDGEWVMNNQNIKVEEYEKLPEFFNPTQFDAAEWVSMVKAAGMKYITITSKHHDGFAMYDSEVSDYDIVDRTQYGKDVIGMLAEECKKQGIKLYLYYSQLDWHHPDYYPRGRTGRDTGRPESGNWENYLNYQNAQIKELAENYDIAGFWFDGWWDKVDKDELSDDKVYDDVWKLDETYSMIHGVNDYLMIGNNHHTTPFPGEDFQMFEKDLPGHNTTGFGSSEDDISQLPLETAETINHSWGFNLQDDHNKSVKNLIQYLVKAAGYNSNFLLNVGPMPNGKIQENHVETLNEIGKWLDKNGESIYGTRGGPVAPASWGVSTQKDDKIYLHAMNPGGNSVLVNGLEAKIKSIQYFEDRSSVSYEKTKYGLVLNIPKEKMDETDTIIEITTR